MTRCVITLKETNRLRFHSNTTIYVFIFIFTLTTCFGQLTIVSSSVQNLESDVCSANSIHVIWDPIKLTDCIKILK